MLNKKIFKNSYPKRVYTQEYGRARKDIRLYAYK